LGMWLWDIGARGELGRTYLPRFNFLSISNSKLRQGIHVIAFFLISLA
jgi:hypothetical protein